MNDRAQTLLVRFLLLFLLFFGLALGLLWLILPLLAIPPGSLGLAILNSLPAVCGITLALAGALSFSWYSDGSSERADPYGIFGSAFGLIIFFAIGATLYASMLLPDLQKKAVHERNRPAGQRHVRPAIQVQQLKDGIRHYYEARFDTAIDHFQAFLKNNPENVFADWYLKAARNELARQQQLRNQPRSSTQAALFSRGYDLMVSGDYLLAIIEFERVLAINPGHSLAKKQLAEARAKLRARKSITPDNSILGGLKARIEQVLGTALELFKNKKWRDCLSLADQVLLLDPANPTAIRLAGQCRDTISKTDFLDDELLVAEWLPSLGPVLLPTADGRLLAARRLTAGTGTLWIRDFWLVPATNQGEMLRGGLAKLTLTNQLVLRDALRVTREPASGRSVILPVPALRTSLQVRPELLATAAMVYSENRSVHPLAIINQSGDLLRLGLPPLPLWHVLARQLTLPFTIFLLSAVACAAGWRYRERTGRRTGTLLRLLSIPILAILLWFLSDTLGRLLSALVMSADALGLHGWAAIPVYAVLTLILTFTALSRLIRH